MNVYAVVSEDYYGGDIKVFKTQEQANDYMTIMIASTRGGMDFIIKEMPVTDAVYTDDDIEQLNN